MSNSRKVLHGPDAALPEGDLAAFRFHAPMSSAHAATVILDGVRSGTWRILVGNDAHRLDERVRRNPVAVYGAGGIHIEELFDDDGALVVMQTLAQPGGGR